MISKAAAYSAGIMGILGGEADGGIGGVDASANPGVNGVNDTVVSGAGFDDFVAPCREREPLTRDEDGIAVDLGSEVGGGRGGDDCVDGHGVLPLFCTYLNGSPLVCPQLLLGRSPAVTERGQADRLDVHVPGFDAVQHHKPMPLAIVPSYPRVFVHTLEVCADDDAPDMPAR